MAILDRIKVKVFDRKRSLKDVSLDELHHERIRLEQEEARLARQVDELEAQKQQLFLQGKEEASERQLLRLAREIKKLDARAKNTDKNQRLISHQLRIIDGLIQVKENQRLFQETGISRLLNDMDLEELQVYVEQASVEGAFHIDRFRRIIEGMEESEAFTELTEEDEEVLEIVQAMQEAKQVDLEAPEAVEDLARRRLDEILSKEEPEAEL